MTSTNFAPLSDFPHLTSATNKIALTKALSWEDFENGLNPLEPSLLNVMEKDTNLLRSLHKKICSWEYTYHKQHTVKEQEKLIGLIQEKAIEYSKSGVFKKGHIISFFKNVHLLTQKHTAHFVYRCMEEGIIELGDKIEMNGYPIATTTLEVPVLFALRSRYVRPFFEKFGSEAIKNLQVYVYQLYPTNPEKNHPSNIKKSIGYLEYASIYKDKTALALCEEYFKEDKLQQEQKIMDKLLGDTIGPREKLKILTEEVKKHNSLLPANIDNPKLEKVLKLKKSNKNLLFYAIDSKNVALLEKMLTMPLFLARKAERDSLGHCALGYAAHKGQIQVEKFLLENNYYDLLSFGDYQSINSLYKQNPQLELYRKNASKLSDESCLALMDRGFLFDPADLIMEKNIEAYTRTLQERPEILKTPHLLSNIDHLSENWMEKGWHTYGHTNYMPTQNHIPIVLETIRVMRHSNSESYTAKADRIETKFLNSLSKLNQPVSAGFAMNLYLKYFPGQEKKLTQALSGLTNPWAVKLDKKNIEAELQKFLRSMDKPAKKEAAGATPLPPPRRLNKI